MRITEHLYFYVEVTFGNSARRYSYICNDLRVKVGDTVEVPAGNNQQIKATVVSTLFCTAGEAPYPVEKTKTVIGWASNTFSQSSAENGLVPTAEKNSIIPSESVSAACSITPQEASVSQTDSIAKSTADNTEKKSVTAGSSKAKFSLLDLLELIIFVFPIWTFICTFINYILLIIACIFFFGVDYPDAITKSALIFSFIFSTVFFIILYVAYYIPDTKTTKYVKKVIAWTAVILMFVSFWTVSSKIDREEELKRSEAAWRREQSKKFKSSKTTTYRTSGNNNSSGTRKSSGKKKSSDSDDKYNADDYSHPDDFYYDHYDDFFDYEEAEDYWKEHHDD